MKLGMIEESLAIGGHLCGAGFGATLVILFEPLWEDVQHLPLLLCVEFLARIKDYVRFFTSADRELTSIGHARSRSANMVANRARKDEIVVCREQT